MDARDDYTDSLEDEISELFNKRYLSNDEFNKNYNSNQIPDTKKSEEDEALNNHALFDSSSDYAQNDQQLNQEPNSPLRHQNLDFPRQEGVSNQDELMSI